jgi:hypothetical protein
VGENRDERVAPPGAVHEELKQKEAGRFSGDPETQMGYGPASDADEPAEDTGTARYPGGDEEEKLERGGGGDETARER